MSYIWIYWMHWDSYRYKKLVYLRLFHTSSQIILDLALFNQQQKNSYALYNHVEMQVHTVGPRAHKPLTFLLLKEEIQPCRYSTYQGPVSSYTCITRELDQYSFYRVNLLRQNSHCCLIMLMCFPYQLLMSATCDVMHQHTSTPGGPKILCNFPSQNNNNNHQ